MPRAPRPSIEKRKSDHLRLCIEGDVEFRRKRTWFDCVELVHEAVPAETGSQVDTSTSFLGRTLAAPFIIGAMTGGTAQGGTINTRLAEVAQEKRIGLALGSQRAMLENAAAEKTYQVRRKAPDILLLANIGIAQAVSLSTEEVEGLIARIGADGINVHLNTAMEMSQNGGDLPVGEAWAAIARLAKALGERLIIKETGCGIARETGTRLARLGVRTIDAAGAGGTSWVRVENLRRGEPPQGLGAFEEWGIPTAASLLELQGVRARVIASGGLRTGLDLAKAIALGAEIGSAALPVLRALEQGGTKGLNAWIDSVAAGLRAAMILTGCSNLNDLRHARCVITGPLLQWISQRRRRRRVGEQLG